MPYDRRLSRPQDYMDDAKKFFRDGRRDKIDYKTAFQNKASEGEVPFNFGRFGAEELTKKIASRKLTENPRLELSSVMGEVSNVFTGLGRFDRETDYNFIEGRANTIMNFKYDENYNPLWAETYSLSPTVVDKVSSPMPTDMDPDPKGILMSTAETRIENEAEGNLSIAQILSQGKEG